MQTRTRKGSRSPNARFQTAEDPQRHLVYDWEDEWRDWHLNSLTLEECRVVVRTACRFYKLSPPIVVQHNYRGLSWCDGSRISLQAVGFRRRGAKNLATVLHETSHFIATRLYPRHQQDHGPTFLGVFMWLLEESKVAPSVALQASARSFGLRWREAHPCKN